jgi:putative component of toxin-antitoxin plasmid stabilization module
VNLPDQRIGGRSNYRHPVENAEWAETLREQRAKAKERLRLERTVGRKLRDAR